jgi:hypothetical protein
VGIVKLLTLLIVTVMGTGGPPPVRNEPKEKPRPLANGVVTVSRYTKTGLRFVGRTTDGKLKLHVRPGDYRLEAYLRGAPTAPCKPKTIRIKRDERQLRVKLACQTK